MLKGNLLVAQGGGPTAVINQSLAGIILEAIKSDNIENIYGSLRGVEGIANNDLVLLSGLSEAHINDVAATPGSALFSTRVKPDAEYCRKMFENIKKRNIRYFFYIGGNDSSDTVRIVSEHAKNDGYRLRAVHIPKTIDNDLVINDHTPGFGSAARFVASAFAGVDFDNRSLGGVYIGVVMGRHAGFLTAAAALGRADSEAGPHLIYLPERTFDIEKFSKDVESVYKRHGRCVVAVSEGISDNAGTPIVTKLMQDVERDAHGNVQLSGTGALGDLLAEEIKAKTGIKRVRADTLGYLQRSFLGVTSETDAAEARQAGEFGVKQAMVDSSSDDFSVVMLRNAGSTYSVRFETRPLTDIAAKTKLMDDSFINPEGNNVTQKFIDYAFPLIGDFKKGTALTAKKEE